MAVRRRPRTGGGSRAAAVTAGGDHPGADTRHDALPELTGYGLRLYGVRPYCAGHATRCVAVTAVAEAMAGGTAEDDACLAIGISSDTLHSWRRAQGPE